VTNTFSNNTIADASQVNTNFGDVANCFASGSVIPQFKGVTTNSSAATGIIGEYKSASVASGSAIALTGYVAANITSISLTAGDWDVSMNCGFSGGATTVVYFALCGVNTTSATLPDPSESWNFSAPSGGLTVFANSAITGSVPATRISVASTTTVYLVA